MSIRIDELVKRRAEVPVEYRGQTARVSYRPDAFTPAMEREARARQAESDWTTGVVLDMLEPLIADWDLTTLALDEDGEVVYDEAGDPVEVKIPVTRAGMEGVPINLLLEMLRQVTEDMRPNPTSAETSKGGSFTRVK